MTLGTTSNPGDRNVNPDGLGFWELVAEDLATHDRDILSQGFWTLFWHRFGNWRMGIKNRVLQFPFTTLYRAMYKVTQWICGIDLAYTVIIWRRVRIEHFGGMILTADRIGDDVLIRQNVTMGIVGPEAPYHRPAIEDGVQIGAGAVIVGSVLGGQGALVGANAVVVRNVAPGGRVGGIPARPIDKTPVRSLRDG